MLIGLFHAPGEKDASQRAYVDGSRKRKAPKGDNRNRTCRNQVRLLDRGKRQVDELSVPVRNTTAS